MVKQAVLADWLCVACVDLAQCACVLVMSCRSKHASCTGLTWLIVGWLWRWRFPMAGMLEPTRIRHKWQRLSGFCCTRPVSLMLPVLVQAEQGCVPALFGDWSPVWQSCLLCHQNEPVGVFLLSAVCFTVGHEKRCHRRFSVAV